MTSTAAPATSQDAPRSAGSSLAGPLSGIAVTVLSFVAVPPTDPDSTTAAAIRAWVEQNELALRSFGAVMAVTAVALLVFVSHLRQLMRGADPQRAYLADVAYGSGVLCAVWLLVSGAMSSVLAYDFEKLGNDMVVQYYGLAAVGDMIGTSALVFKGALLVSVSLVAVRTGLLPRWLSWTGLVLGLLTLGGLVGAFTDATIAGGLFYAGLFAFALWPLPVGVALALRGLRARRS